MGGVGEEGGLISLAFEIAICVLNFLKGGKATNQQQRKERKQPGEGPSQTKSREGEVGALLCQQQQNVPCRQQGTSLACRCSAQAHGSAGPEPWVHQLC